VNFNFQLAGWQAAHMRHEVWIHFCWSFFFAAQRLQCLLKYQDFGLCLWLRSCSGSVSLFALSPQVSMRYMCIHAESSFRIYCSDTAEFRFHCDRF
jgi:hypothetical protein